MKIESIELTGFRGFAQTQYLDLNADAVICVGQNGRGKTSLFDGILWALTGKIPRLGNGDSVISKYSLSGEARAVLKLRSQDNDICSITRSFDGELQRLSVDFKGETTTDDFAAAKLFQIVWPEALLTTNSVDSLTTAITRSVYLQQDLVRQFVETDNDQDRFKCVSELVGTGRVTELQLALERSRNAWTRATTSQQKDSDSAHYRLSTLQNQLNSLIGVSEEDVTELELTWAGWWKQSQQLGISIELSTSVTSSDASGKLDEAIRQLGMIRQSVGRQNDIVNELISNMQSKPSLAAPDPNTFRVRLEGINNELQSCREELAKTTLQAAEERKRQIELRETVEELRAMAELALRHLGPECPVCGQKYDESATRERLNRLIGNPSKANEEMPLNERIKALTSAIQDKERERIALAEQLQRAERITEEYDLWRKNLDRRLLELKIASSSDFENIATSLTQLNQDLKTKLNTLISQQKQGEQITLKLARAAEMSRRAEIEKEIQEQQDEVSHYEALLKSRNSTSQLAGQIIDGLRDAAYFMVQKQLTRIEPLLQSIYSTFDPHPSFRTVNFLSNFYRGHGVLNTEIHDVENQVSSDAPNYVLSSSQMNALAVAIFLAFNLSIKSIPIDAAILDDPIQSLDDVNLLGIIDLLRRVRDKRQLFVSTHDIRFGRLLEQKLRPVHNQKTMVIEFRGWGREGPTVSYRYVDPDLKPLRISV